MVLSDKSNGHLGWKKWFISGWAFMECFLFGGLLSGWGSISFVLKMEGIYAELCDDLHINSTVSTQTSPNTTISTMSGLISTHSLTTRQDIIGGPVKVCKRQDEKMALCFTIASAVMGISSALVGFVNYKYGTRVTRLISFCIFVSGAVMMALISKDHPWLIFPGLTLLSTGALSVLITNMQVTYLFTAKASIVVGMLNGGYDGSSAVMLFMKYFAGTLNKYLTRILDTTNDVSYFTNVCYYIMLGGLVTSFLSGAVFNFAKSKCKDCKSPLYRKMMPSVPPLALTSMFAVLMSVMILIPVIEVLYPIFIVMTIFRSLLYSSAIAYLRNTFPSEYFAFLYLPMTLLSSIISSVQYGIFAWAEAYEKGPLHADTSLLCVTFLSFAHPLYWWITCRTNEKQFKETLALQHERNGYTNYVAE